MFANKDGRLGQRPGISPESVAAERHPQRSAADAAGAQGPHVVSHLLEGARQCRKVALVEVLHEVLLDAALVHDARGV